MLEPILTLVGCVIAYLLLAVYLGVMLGRMTR
jgi:hypothetical protein